MKETTIIAAGPLFLLINLFLPAIIASRIFKTLDNSRLRTCLILISFLLSWLGFIVSIIIAELYKKISKPS